MVTSGNLKMKILQNRPVSVISTRGCERHFILWKGCQLQKKLGNYALSYSGFTTANRSGIP